MGDYVVVRNIYSSDLAYIGNNYVNAKVGSSLKATNVLKNIFVTCDFDDISGNLIRSEGMPADVFNSLYGDIVRYKIGNDSTIHSFYDEEILTQLQTPTHNGYLKITPVFVVKLSKVENGDIPLISTQVFERKPQTLDKPLKLSDIETTIVGDNVEFPNLLPNGLFLYSQYPSQIDNTMFLIYLTKGNPNNDYHINDDDDSTIYNYKFSYNGLRYKLENRLLELSYVMVISNSINDIYFRVDGIESVLISFNRGNYFKVEDTFVDDEITCVSNFSDGTTEYSSFHDIEYVSGTNFLSNNSLISTNGIYNIQVKILTYSGSGQYVYSNILDLYAYSNVPHHIQIETIKPTYGYGEGFVSSSITCNIFYLVSGTTYYKDFLSKQSYTLNVDNGTKLYEDTNLTATLISNNSLTSTIQLTIVINNTNDLLIYDKETNEETNFGSIDISNGFNMCFNLDNTRDSAKIQILNDKDYALEKNTICKLTSNYTWWVVKSDQKSVKNDENGKFIHNIELVSPKSIFYARDLTSCGFNKNRYTYGEFFNRLISLSKGVNCDVSLSDVFGDNNKVSIIKSFDNYTLGKALEEFSNGENAIYELDYIDIDNPYIYFISKSGTNNDIIDLDTSELHSPKFIRHEEIGNKDFATKVISNVENAISSVYQRYPINGGKFLDSDKYLLDKDNAFFKLPSKAKEVRKLFIHPRVKIALCQHRFEMQPQWTELSSSKFFYVSSYEQVLSIVNSMTFDSFWFSGRLKTREQLAKEVFNISIIEMNIDKQENKLKSNSDSNIRPLFMSENLSSKYENAQWNISFKNGEDKITNFKCADYVMNNGTRIELIKTDLFNNHNSNISPTVDNLISIASYFPNDNIQQIEYAILILTDFGITTLNTKFACEYIPQADFRMEYDNFKNGKDVALFNQTGNFVDNFAVSKLVKSYATDISGNTYNFYNIYDQYFDILQKGQRVFKTINGKKELCIITNVSITTHNGSKYEVMYSLSKYSAVKSSLISADSNIRDYDCPQRNNVVRKQNYRDFIELELDTTDRHNETMFGNIQDILNFGFKSKGANFEYQAFIKIENNRYYQIPTYVVNYDSSCTCIIDFKDNNIIGYDKSNTGTVLEWEISAWNSFMGSTSRYNIPIDYTIGSGNFGEVKSIEIKLANQTQIDNAFATYKTANGLGSLDNSYSILDIAPLCFANYYSIISQSCKITESDYKKDGLEIPFFQYTAQLGNTNNVIVGSHILEKKQTQYSTIIVYQFHVKDKIKANNYNYNNVELSGSNGVDTITLQNACVLSLDTVNMKIVSTFYSYATINVLTGAISNTRNFKLDGTIKNKNIEIVLGESGIYVPTADLTKTINESELVFAINNCPVELDSNSQLSFFINNYKL